MGRVISLAGYAVKGDNRHMRGELKKTFKLAVKQSLAPLGYSKNSGTIFACDLSPGVLGCIGYLTSNALSGVKIFVGVRFEHVEKIYEELMEPFFVVPKSTSRYFPSMFLDLYNLKQERSADPNFRHKESSYIRVETHTISDVVDRLLVDVKQYGIPYIAFNATLTNAAATIVDGRGGGIGTVAYRLPIMYWILGRAEEAKRYLVSTAGQGYVFGPYEKYAALLAARIDAGPAPLPLNVH
jgi:hypothetical protein